jgi:hypothetical protein
VLGNGNTIDGGTTLGFGDNIQVVGSNNALAASASAAGASVFGSGNAVNATNAFVLANNSTVTGAIAIGNGTPATRANQQVFGTASSTHTMPGVGSASSKAAQSGPTRIVTADAGGNLATTTLSALGLASTADVNAIAAHARTLGHMRSDLVATTLPREFMFAPNYLEKS